jgi:tripartite ATP-independent transporter DctP family solute receptor
VKKFIACFLFVSMLVILGACGGTSSSGDGTNDAEDTSEGSSQAENESVTKGEEVEKVTFKLSTPDPDGSSITVAAQELAERINEQSNGSIEIKVHPNGTLYGGDPSAGVRQLGEGSLDMLVLSTSLYANFKPQFSAISIPYLFDDSEQFISFLNDEPGTKLIESISDLGIKGLGFWTRDFRQITNSKKPIEKPEDLKGLKLRVPNNPLWVEFFKGTGAVTTPMDFSEVYNALQLGTIDGQENPVDVPLATKFYEVQDYLTMSNHMADGWVVGINAKKFNQLSEEHQQLLIDATAEMQTWKLEYDHEQAEITIDELVNHGMEVNTLTPEQQQAFVEVSKQAFPEFKKLIEDDEFFDEVLEFVDKAE